MRPSHLEATRASSRANDHVRRLEVWMDPVRAKKPHTVMMSRKTDAAALERVACMKTSRMGILRLRVKYAAEKAIAGTHGDASTASRSV